MPDMLQHALEYLERGWSIVPCPAGKKVPHVKWATYQIARASEELVRHWWAKWPDAGIALVTGKVSGVVVVDIDEREGASVDGHAITPCMVRTPGGHHLIYAHPGGDERVANSAESGTDVRGDGGITILPPSRHKSGNRYAWTLNGEPSPMPQWVRERKPAPKEAAPIDPAQLDLDSVSEHRPDWIEVAFDRGAKPGERNHTLAKLAGYFAGTDQPEAITLAMLRSWAAGLSAPMDREEVDKTIRSVYATERRRHPETTQPTNTPAPTPAPTKESKPTPAKPDAFALTRFDHYMAQHLGTTDVWDIEGWLPSSTIAMLIAPPGSFKTWIEFDIALTLALGKPFFDGALPGRMGPVIMAQQEDKPGDIAARMAGIQWAKSGLAAPRQISPGVWVLEFPGTPPIYFHQDMRLHLGNAEVMGRLTEHIKSLGAIAVIGDPLYSMVPTEDHMAAAARLMLQPKQIRNETECSFIFAHHTSKGSVGIRSRNRMHGSNLLAGSMETMLEIHRLGPEGSTQIAIEPHTKSEAALISRFVDFEIDLNGGVYNPKSRTITSETFNALLQADERGDITRGQVDEILAKTVHEPAPKPEKRTAKGPSKRGQSVMNELIGNPTDAATLCERLDLTTSELKGTIVSLMRDGHICTDGDGFALTFDPTTLAS